MRLRVDVMGIYKPDLHRQPGDQMRVDAEFDFPELVICRRRGSRFIGAIYRTPHGLRFISKYAVAPVVMPDETRINKLSIIELLYEEIHA